MEHHHHEPPKIKPVEIRQSAMETSEIPAGVVLPDTKIVQNAQEKLMVEKAKHDEIYTNYLTLSEESQALYGKFMHQVTESKRAGGEGVQEAIFTFSMQNSIPQDLKHFLQNTYGSLLVPEHGDNKALFGSNLNETQVHLRTKQLNNEIYNTNRVEPPPEENHSMWGKITRFFGGKKSVAPPKSIPPLNEPLPPLTPEEREEQDTLTKWL